MDHITDVFNVNYTLIYKSNLALNLHSKVKHKHNILNIMWNSIVMVSELVDEVTQTKSENMDFQVMGAELHKSLQFQYFIHRPLLNTILQSHLR